MPGPAYCFERGDWAPDFVLPDVLGVPVQLYRKSNGKPMVLLFCARDHEHMLDPFAKRAAAFDSAELFIVTRLTQAENKALANRVVLPFALLADRPGEVSAAYRGAGPGGPADPALTTYTLGIDRRILHVDRGDDANAQAERALECLEARLSAGDPPLAAQAAPVLCVPDVLDSTVCDELIEIWHKHGNRPSGSISTRNPEGETFDDDVKIRRDHFVTDRALNIRLSNLVGRRIAPAMAKAFCFEASRFEEFKICRYDADDGGHFRPHRDNSSRRTAHRRFAMSLLLNDVDDYDGGGLRFAEYGPRLYRPPAGAAVVFSCSLLHELTKVTRGHRYVLLAFLFGEAEERLRRSLR